MDETLLQALNQWDFYKQPHPKSLGKEEFDEFIVPILNQSKSSIENKLRTVVEHVSIQIAPYIKQGKALITGGGAYNSFLINRIQEKSEGEIHIPDTVLVNFKEAMIFAFLGVLRKREEVNILSSVTGASQDSIGGRLFEPEA